MRLPDVLLAVILLTTVTASGDQRDRRVDDEDPMTAELQMQAATISQLQARLTAMETDHQTDTQLLNQKIRQLESTVSSLASHVPTGANQPSRDQLQGTNVLLSYYLAYAITSDHKFQQLLTNIPNIKEMMQEAYPLRLVHGNGPREGRVEVRVGGTWGTVCDDGVTDNMATVVCRQLNYSSSHANQFQSAKFGAGSGLTLLDDVGCTGAEKHLMLCPSQPLLVENCGHNEDVSVLCVP